MWITGPVESWHRVASALLGSVVPRPGNDCGLVECEPGWSWNPRTNDFDLWLVLAGHGTAQLAGQSVDLVAGMMVVLRTGDAGRFEHERDHPLTVAYCHFDLFAPGSTQPVRVAEDLLPSRVVRLAVPAIEADQMRALIRHASDPRPFVAVERTALLTTVLLDIYRQDAAQHGHPVTSMVPRIQRVVGRIRARPGQRMSLAAASELADL